MCRGWLLLVVAFPFEFRSGPDRTLHIAGEGYYVVGAGLLRLGLTLVRDLDPHALDRGVLVPEGVKITRTPVSRNQVPS